jgi:NitT/TauT family transport system substrate-binding protein
MLLAGAAQAETLKVAVGQKGFWDTSIAVWGDRAGFFKKEGLTLDILYTDGGAETQQAVISGSVEIGIGTGTLGVLGAVVRHAPVRAFTAEWHGASDLYWYVRAADPIRSLRDAAGKTAGFSAVGSSSHLILLSLLDAAGVQAKPTPTGGAGATLTQVMSGQVDLGWSAPPVGLREVDAGQIRIVARGADLPALAEQTTRVNIVNANYLGAHRDVVERFARAYRASLAWAYADTQAITWYAEGLGVDVAVAQRVRDEFYHADAMQPDTVRGLETTLRQAIELKRVPPATTIGQARTMVDIVGAAQ